MLQCALTEAFALQCFVGVVGVFKELGTSSRTDALVWLLRDDSRLILSSSLLGAGTRGNIRPGSIQAAPVSQWWKVKYFAQVPYYTVLYT